MRILLSWGHHGWMRTRTKRMIETYRQAGYDITEVNHRDIIGEDRTYTPTELYERYHACHPGLMELYRQVTEQAATHDILMVIYDNVYVPEFLQSLNGIYKVYFCDDDPEGSDVRSKPYVHAFDYSFAAAVNQDEKTKTWQKYLEWGAPRAAWYPLGVTSDDYEAASVDSLYHEARPIDVIYVGAADPHKVQRVIELAKQIDIRVYGAGWNRYLTRTNGLMKVVPRPLQRFVSSNNKHYLPDDQIISTYRSTKIGINIHESYGPCNRRMFSLPANGVMQLCDCPEGLSDVFEVGKEVVVYHSIPEAIELIKYYLAHEEERIRIAAAGFERVMKDYTLLPIFSRIIGQIVSAMRQDGITHWVNGHAI